MDKIKETQGHKIFEILMGNYPDRELTNSFVAQQIADLFPDMVAVSPDEREILSNKQEIDYLTGTIRNNQKILGIPDTPAETDEDRLLLKPP